MIELWTYNDFLTFLLLLAAKNDLEITEEESDEIIKKVGEAEYKKVKREFDNQNDAQHINTVSTLYKKFESQIGGKENLIKALKEIFTLNNRHEHAMDQYMVLMLRKIL